MIEVVVICSDGSEIAKQAARSSVHILGPARRTIVTTVIEPPDEMDLTGTGTAGGLMTPEGFADSVRTRRAQGQAVADDMAVALELAGAETQVLEGDPGPMLCEFAVGVRAGAIVMGSRGQGRLKRAVLGSVSDHVVRNAPCPVMILGPAGASSPS